VVHVPTLKPLDLSFLQAWDGSYLVTVEDHSVIGGLGSAVAEYMAESGFSARLIRVGYPDVFPKGYGTQDEMRARYFIDAEAIYRKVLRVLSERNRISHTAALTH
jgi:transketolase